MTILVSVQGNIGSGKSTFVEFMKNHYKDNKKICFLQEPVDTWTSIQDKDGKNIIEKYYENQSKYAFAFQMMAYISRLQILEKALEEDYDIIISERSLLADRNIFAKMLYDDNIIDDIEYKIYLKWFDNFTRKFPQELYVYVRVDPDISNERVLKRGRKGENIPIEYLKKCHQYHEDWLMNENLKNKIILSCNKNIENNIDYKNDKERISWMNKVFEVINEMKVKNKK